MNVYHISYPIQEQDFKPSIIAIGFFDGIHLGHQEVIKKACQIARERNLPCGVMTFNPHPKEVMGIKDKIDQITPVNHKVKQLGLLDLDFCYLVNFTREFASISPEQFVAFLQKLNVKGVVVGFDFTFGYKGLGTSETLKQLTEGILSVDIVEPFYDQGVKVSSTRVRDYLLSGQIIDVNRLLGRNFSLKGKVIHGDKRGRTIGFPTANLQLIEDYLQIKHGVYVVKATIDGKPYAGVMNVGYKPTFNEGERVTTYEVYIIDFNKDIYDQIIEVELVDYIREEKKFKSIDDLIKQISIDVVAAKEIMVKTTL